MFEEIIPVPITESLTVNAVIGYTDFAREDELVFIFAPHPLLGGDLNNNVVDTLFKGYISAGKIAVKFSYRGVDSGYVGDEPFLTYWDKLERTKQFSHIVEDSQKVIDAVTAQFSPEASLVFVSYSFGNIISLELQQRFAIKKFIGIAPPVNEYNFEPLFRCNRGTSYIIPDNDVFCASTAMRDYAKQYDLKITSCGDDHFFRGNERQLLDTTMTMLEG
ncbi:MAG: hypothetical protein C4541_01065 [Candidatus Auribacter fodinae]|jgi:alpha/beta superfamily hydrolase|uniref:Serine aminopeptidase S33 domain-containing protein n=1 Tax=Candidatus Auribacter fodinae TaxID=2093366 RepID=A0A3A4R660_9BACT|nr:MAG: hypothetical protein C4541_01065 [Candidatus Auribacter fodinae]